MLNGAAHFNSMYNWYNLYRDVVSMSLIETLIQLGGAGTIAEIDASKWGA